MTTQPDDDTPVEREDGTEAADTEEAATPLTGEDTEPLP